MRFFLTAVSLLCLSACGSDTRHWHAPELIGTAPQDASDPKIVFASDGAVMASWAQTVILESSVHANRHADQIGWGGASPLVDYFGNGRAFHHIVALPDGEVLVVFVERANEPDSALGARLFTPGAGWSVFPVPLSQGSYHELFRPVVGDDGVLYLVWTEESLLPSGQGTSDLLASQYAPGQGWTMSEFVDSGDGPVFTASVAMDRSGTAFLVWSQYDEFGDSQIQSSRWTGPGGWSVPENISGQTRFAHVPQIAVREDGEAVAVWRESDQWGSGIYSNSFRQDTGWQGKEYLGYATGIQYSPRIAAETGGGFTVVWSAYTDARVSAAAATEIYAAHRNAQGDWQGEAAMVDMLDGGSRRPAIGTHPSGGSMIVWAHADDAFEIVAMRSDGFGNWGAPQLVHSMPFPGPSPNSPEIALDTAGNAIAVWLQSTGSGDEVYVSRYQ